VPQRGFGFRNGKHLSFRRPAGNHNCRSRGLGKIFGHLPHAFLWVMFPWRNRSHAQRRNQPSRAALRMRRYRRRLLHDGENYFRLKARTDELECLLRAVELLRAIEPARADIEAALTLLFVELHDPVLAQAVALLILDHRRNAT
jgi:hypothetical protein